MSPIANGVTASGHIMPLSSCEDSIIAPTNLEIPIPYEPICTGTVLPFEFKTLAFIGSEYLEEKLKI